MFIKREYYSVFLVTILGTVIRYANIGVFPPLEGFSSIEETQRANGAYLILNYGLYPWEWAFPQYYTALLFYFFGRSMLTIKIGAAALGCLTIPIFYFLLRSLFSFYPSIIATFFLAISRWHVQTGWYMDDVYAPLIIFISALHISFQLKANTSIYSYILLAMLCALTLHEYAAYRVTTLVALCVLYIQLSTSSEKKRFTGRILLFLSCTFLFSFNILKVIYLHGIGTYFESLNRSFANRSYYTTSLADFLLLRYERILNSLNAIFWNESKQFFETLNTDNLPLVDSGAGFLFFMGFIIIIYKRENRLLLTLSVTFLLLFFGATTLVQNLDFRRLAILIPFVFIFIAQSVDFMLFKITKYLPVHITYFTLAGITLWSFIINVNFIFYKMPGDGHACDLHKNEYTVPAFFLNHSWQGEYVVLLTPKDDYVVNNFFTGSDFSWILPDNINGEVLTDIEKIKDTINEHHTYGKFLILIQRNFPISDYIDKIKLLFKEADCYIKIDRHNIRHDLGTCRINI